MKFLVKVGFHEATVEASTMAEAAILGLEAVSKERPILGRGDGVIKLIVFDNKKGHGFTMKRIWVANPTGEGT